MGELDCVCGCAECGDLVLLLFCAVNVWEAGVECGAGFEEEVVEL